MQKWSKRKNNGSDMEKRSKDKERVVVLGRLKASQFSTMTMQASAPAGRIFVSVLTLCRTKNWNKIFYAL